MSKRARETDTLLRAMGFVLHRDTRHRIYRHPAGGPQLVCPKTPSDVRGWKNTLGDARRIVRALEATG
jgi:predicted RNA binding protein YcfA (HicA-like mRNA interferase family)